jgi:hypothetical protein
MPVYSFGPFRLDGSKRLLESDGALFTIGGRTLDLLIALVDRAGDVLSVRELMALVWPSVTVEEANLRVDRSALPKVLGDGKDGAAISSTCPDVASRLSRCPDGGNEISSHRGACSYPSPWQLPKRRSFCGPRRHDQASLPDADDAAVRQRGRARRHWQDPGPMAVANTLRPAFDDDRVCFFDGGAISDPDDLPGAVAATLGCAVEATGPLPEIVA